MACNNNNNNNELHIVMLPWSGFGHMIPFHHLAISLAKQGVRVSYASTPKNIARLPQIPQNLAPLVQHISLPMPEVLDDSGTPITGEATSDMEDRKYPYLKLAYDLLRDPFKQFVLTHSPDWIICDLHPHWMPEVAQECHVKLMMFSIFATSFISFVGPPEYLCGPGLQSLRPDPESLTVPPPWGTDVFPSSVAFRDYEAPGFYSAFLGNNASGVSDGERLAKMLEGCQAIAIRSCKEIEGEYIDLCEKLMNKPVLPVGLLRAETNHIEENNALWKDISKWLDEQRPASVIYIGLGSEIDVTKGEVYELAYGLEIAKIPFVWALRKPVWATRDADALPQEFLTNMKGKGMVCHGWVPQAKILANRSIGGTLVHSGWGSIVETLQHGHNLVVLPFVIDQGLNARIVVEKGLGIEVERLEDGSYTRNQVASALRRAMLGEEALQSRVRAKESEKLFSAGIGDDDYISQLVRYLRGDSLVQLDALP